LHEQAVDICGIDLSPEMIRCAARLCPGVEFRVGDMRTLDFETGTLAGIVAFYSIVHLEPAELDAVFKECRRVLAPEGPMLLAFHIGDESVHVDDLWGQPVDLDFRFHTPSDVTKRLQTADLIVVESAEREPYEGVEYPSRRCYLLAKAR
jgi:SAM-dependent methyltransferase